MLYVWGADMLTLRILLPEPEIGAVKEGMGAAVKMRGVVRAQVSYRRAPVVDEGRSGPAPLGAVLVA